MMTRCNFHNNNNNKGERASVQTQMKPLCCVDDLLLLDRSDLWLFYIYIKKFLSILSEYLIRWIRCVL